MDAWSRAFFASRCPQAYTDDLGKRKRGTLTPAMEGQNNPQESRGIFRRRWALFAIIGVVLVLVAGMLTATHFINKAKEHSGLLAPGFVLRDQEGRLTSLAQFRGKVVVLTFIDPECTQLCPLTTKSMVDALKILGPAVASQVQLLGINVNSSKTQVSDVAAYTREHELQGRWRFLTGSPAQLKKVWHNYHVYVAKKKGSDDVIHEAIVFIINRSGYESSIYSTPMSYESVGAQAQTLARNIAKVLPGQPAIPASSQTVEQQQEEPLKPTQTVSLMALGPDRQPVIMGGAHPHLLLFFAGWLGKESNLSKNLATLDSYAALARRRHWPSPVAVDELPTEPSAAEARKVLAPLVATLHTPIVQDTER
ncbi:MAG: SCO family protein [Acidobacteria bacterium]|nr:SCO family protein [Acidobacteriota bacterium]